MTESHLRCRVCGQEARFLDAYSPYKDFEVPVYECGECGSRLAPHDPAIHERMHRCSSTYDAHDVLTAECREHLERKDEGKLRELLSRMEKFKFIIDTVDAFAGQPARVLEIGSSSGGLGSWFILRGHKYTGIDISESAVRKAQSLFGEDYFRPLSNWDLGEQAPFDVIVHAGTIGCVGNPMELTSDLLGALRPGGILVFNAPNRDACYRPGQLWVEMTHPPDLVTLFRPGIWKEHFGDRAEVSTEIDHLKGWPAIETLLAGRANAPWQWNATRALFSEETGHVGTPKKGRRKKSAIRRLGRKATNLICPRILDGRWPTDFGVFVTMKKR